jgi:hypothetical protein
LQIISPSRRILQSERPSSPRERETFMTTAEMESMTTAQMEACLDEELEKLQIAAHENPVVARCGRAWLLYYCQAIFKGESDASARFKARRAYQLAMPPLTGSRNVRNFIACVTHGMLLGALDGNEATKLLYAAQVAHTARRSNNKTKKTRSATGLPGK